jgi:hypothetical protein
MALDVDATSRRPRAMASSLNAAAVAQLRWRAMAMGYFYLNACLYLAFAVWCTAAPFATSSGLGYLRLSSGGRSEYLVIYGGLQLGVAAIYYLLARAPTAAQLGVMMSIALYAPIVVFRAVTVYSEWPVPTLTVATGCLESLLLAGALWLLLVSRGRH